MAAATYLQEAANQVRNAIAALQDEINTIQHDAYSKESQLKGDADKAETEAGLLKVRAASAAGEPGRELGYEARRAQLELEAKQRKQAADKQSAEAARLVQAKNGLMGSLQGVVSQLERLAASAR